MNELLIMTMLLLCAAGCSPTAQQILEMKSWSSAARKSCRIPGACPEPRACIAAVSAASEVDAGRSEYARAQTACWSYAGGAK